MINNNNTLTIALEKVDFLPANRVTDDTSILTLKNLVMEPLCRWQDGRLEPALLNSWWHCEDGQHWLFEIRPDARFHDGEACRAAHILAFIEGILDSRDTFGMPWAYARYFADVEFSAASEYVLQMRSPQPFADVLEIFSEFYICRSNAQGQPILGTGPYRVERFEAGQTVQLSAVADEVTPAHLTLLVSPEAEERYALLRDGHVQVATHLERCHDALDFDPRWHWRRRLNTLSVMQYLNCSEGLFSHPMARLAANHAVDAQAIVDDVFHGLGQASSTVVSPWHTGYQQAALSPLAYSRDRARRLLDRVGGGADIVLRTPLYMPEKALEVT